MEVITTQKTFILHDYDIVFSNGMMMPITVNLDLGDTIEIGDTRLIAHLTAKPSLSDIKKNLPAEDITIFLSQVVSIQHRERSVLELTPNEKVEWAKLFEETVGPLQ